jgi:hypothetical protein
MGPLRVRLTFYWVRTFRTAGETLTQEGLIIPTYVANVAKLVARYGGAADDCRMVMSALYDPCNERSF